MSYRALKKSEPGSKNLKKSKNEIGEENNDIRGQKNAKISLKSRKNNKKIQK